jgi:muramidase (phage lysozyme)
MRKKTYGENCLNYGHIDIRDYETYISDYIAPPPAHHPTWVRNIHTPSAYLEYVNIKIFRKVHDPMPTLHIKAFLRCLQYCETLGAESSKLYRLNRGGPPFTYFEGFREHPAHSMVAGPARDNMAAGAYQIQYRTWKDVIDSNILQLPSGTDTFSPIVQDRIAVVLIEEKNALHLVRTAQTEEAILKLRRTWTSLPGASQNVAGRTMEKFKSNFEQFLEEEKKKAGMK